MSNRMKDINIPVSGKTNVTEAGGKCIHGFYIPSMYGQIEGINHYIAPQTYSDYCLMCKGDSATQ